MVYVYVVTALVLGSLVGYWYAARQRPATPFSAASAEADELRAEASASVQERIERRKTRIVTRAEAVGSVTNDQVEDMFCISDRTARRYLRELVDAGALQKERVSGPGVRYVVPQAPGSSISQETKQG